MRSEQKEIIHGRPALIGYDQDRQSLTKRDFRHIPHPWQGIGFRWEPKQKLWRMLMRPGFVNGEPVLVRGAIRDTGGFSRVTASDMAKAGGALDEVHVSRSDFVSFAEDELMEATEPAWIPLRFGRDIPGVGESPPLAIQKMGVAAKAVNAFSVENGRLKVDQARLDSGPGRRCVAVDLHLSKARVGLAASTTASLQGLAVGQIVDYSVTTSSIVRSSRRSAVDPSGDRPRVIVTPQYEPPVSRDTLAQRLAGDFADDQEDTLLLATVYAVSSYDNGQDESRPVDDTWTILCKNHIFWNLSHAANEIQIPPAFANLSLGILSTLGGGAGFVLGNSILGPINAQMNLVFNALRTQSPVGRFWTT